MQKHLYYQPSGIIPPVGIVFILLFGLASSSVLGYLYAYITYYDPIVYINVLLTVAYGAVTGFVVGQSAKSGKIRNHSVIWIFGAAIGIMATYTQWYVWLSIHFSTWIPPLAVFEGMSVVAEEGAWSMNGVTPTGIFLYLIWLAEALTITVGSAWMAGNYVSDTPFCERCNKWVETQDHIGGLSVISQADSFKNSLENKDFSVITSLKKLSSSPAYTDIFLTYCDSCQDLFFLTVKKVVITIDKNGKEEKDETTIVKHLIIDKSAYELIKSNPYASESVEVPEEENKV